MALALSACAEFLIIDGRQPLAALNFYERTHPDEAESIFVPCVIFDGRSDDFATEMFVNQGLLL